MTMRLSNLACHQSLRLQCCSAALASSTLCCFKAAARSCAFCILSCCSCSFAFCLSGTCLSNTNRCSSCGRNAKAKIRCILHLVLLQPQPALVPNEADLAHVTSLDVCSNLIGDKNQQQARTLSSGHSH